LMNEVNNNIKADMANMPMDIKNMPKPPVGNGHSGMNNIEKVYFVDGNGKVKIMPVKTGLNDGKNTEIISSPGLKEGMKVSTGSQDNSTATTKKSSTLTQQGPPPMM